MVQRRELDGQIHLKVLKTFKAEQTAKADDGRLTGIHFVRQLRDGELGHLFGIMLHELGNAASRRRHAFKQASHHIQNFSCFYRQVLGNHKLLHIMNINP